MEYVAASGALAYDGKGWPWEWPLRWIGLLNPRLFTVFTKTLKLKPWLGNLRWWKPLECIRLFNGDSAVNKVGLTNPGFWWWKSKYKLRIDRRKRAVAVSIFGSRIELIEMAQELNGVDIVAVEVNASCPNTGHPMQDIQEVVDDVRAVRHVSCHPVIVKLSVAQDYCAIASQLQGVVEAVALNSVPWELIFPSHMEVRSPLWRLEQQVGGGGGGVSGGLAQELNWRAVRELCALAPLRGPRLPVIAPSIMEFDDLATVRAMGADAVSFGTLFLRRPWAPTWIVRRDMRLRARS